MRKFRGTIEFNSSTFEPRFVLKYLDENGIDIRLSDTSYDHFEDKEEEMFTFEECRRIDSVNEILAEKDLPLMTLEEKKFFIDPTGQRWKSETLPTDILRLAGYSIEEETKQEIVEEDGVTDVRTITVRHFREHKDATERKKLPEYVMNSHIATVESEDKSEQFLTGIELKEK